MVFPPAVISPALPAATAGAATPTIRSEASATYRSFMVLLFVGGDEEDHYQHYRQPVAVTSDTDRRLVDARAASR
jgi:hypothetical protein